MRSKTLSNQEYNFGKNHHILPILYFYNLPRYVHRINEGNITVLLPYQYQYEYQYEYQYQNWLTSDKQRKPSPDDQYQYQYQYEYQRQYQHNPAQRPALELKHLF